MIGDKPRKTRRVSKKVKKMHKEAADKGLLGSTSAEEKKGGGLFDGPVYMIEFRKGAEVISSEIDGGLFGETKLKPLLQKLESNPGQHIRIEKAANMTSKTKIFKIEEL